MLSLARGTLSGVFGLLMLADTAWSQTFDNFRFVGVTATPIGTVTSLSIDTSTESAGDAGELAYFDASGLSTVFTLSIRPSTIINPQTTTLLQRGDGFDSLSLQNLLDVQFFTGELTNDATADATTPPPNWFRLTRYNGAWSGVFRVGGQVYTIPRSSNSDVVEVRSTLSETVSISPTHRARVSTVFDNSGFQSDGVADTEKQLAALESIHVADGLLADSLGLTLQLEQIIVGSVFNTTGASADDANVTAIDWHQRTQTTTGTDDNLATLFFIEPGEITASSTLANGASVARDEGIILQPYSATEPQFSTTYSFGALLGVGNEAGTLQDWRPAELAALPVVHWSEQQRENFDANTSLVGLLQALPNDQPTPATPTLPVPAPLDPRLVESDAEEKTPLQLLNDSATLSDTASGGGGSAMWLFLFGLLFLRPCGTRARTRIGTSAATR